MVGIYAPAWAGDVVILACVRGPGLGFHAKGMNENVAARCFVADFKELAVGFGFLFCVYGAPLLHQIYN